MARWRRVGSGTWRPLGARGAVWPGTEILAPFVTGQVATRFRACPPLPRIGVDVPDDDLALDVPGGEGVADLLMGREVVEDDRAVQARGRERGSVAAEVNVPHLEVVAGERFADASAGGGVDEDRALAGRDRQRL